MSKTIISEHIRKFFRWCDNHPDFKNADLYAAFPNEGESSLRTRKSKWSKYRKEGKWPEKKDSTSINASINKSTELKEAKQTDISKTSIIENGKNIQETGTSIDTSKSINTSKDAFIHELFKNRDTIMKILNDYEQTGALSPTDIKLEKPFKTVSYSLMEKTLDSFIETCSRIGISQRKAVHIALNDFIQKVD
jgi:hypothetical protein